MKIRFLLTFLTCILLQTLAFSQFQVGHQSFAFDDADRNNRNVWGEVYYPADTAGDDVPVANGTYPLVVFGHGFVTAWSEYEVWWEELVEQGYIVAFPRTEGNITPSHANFGQDLAFIIDAYMNENLDPSSDFYGHFTTKNAVMGHSMGGGASYLAAGDYNANIETLVSMAAANTNPSSIAAAAAVDVPVLALAGELDCVVQNGEGPLDIYNGLTAAPYKAYVEILGASHCNFGINSFFSNCGNAEFCGGFIPKADQHTQMFLSAIPWLDYMLKGDCNAWASFKNHLTTSTTHTYQEMGALPTATVGLNTNDALCSNASVMLTANIDGQYCDIDWYEDGVLIVGADTETLMASSAANYTVEVTNADGLSESDQIDLYKHQLLYSDNFDTGWGNWNNGGKNCRKSILDAPYANSGDFCIRLRDNDFYSKLTSDVFDLSGYDEIRIDFSYYCRSMDNPNEDFWLQMTTDGFTYTTIEEWNKGDEFQNNQRKYDSVIIPGPFTPNTRFRFRCDASGPYDFVYLDNIKIYGCGAGNPNARLQPETFKPETIAIEKDGLGAEKSISLNKVYPVPANDVLNIEFQSEKNDRTTLTIMDISGKLVHQEFYSSEKGHNIIRMDVSGKPNGYYFLVISNGTDKEIRKIVISK